MSGDLAPHDALALAAWGVSTHADVSSMGRLQKAVAVCDRVDVPRSHQALYEAAKQAADSSPEAWPRHAEELNARLRDLSKPADRWDERKDLI